LRDHALISVEDFKTLRSAYLFLRDVENKLQMVDDAQTHSLPREVEGINSCARLLGYTPGQSEPAAEPFLRDLEGHTGRVHRIFETIVGGR